LEGSLNFSDEIAGAWHGDSWKWKPTHHNCLAKFMMRSGPPDFTKLNLPELRRRGLFLEEYEGATLRETLGLSMPANRLRQPAKTEEWSNDGCQRHWCRHKLSCRWGSVQDGHAAPGGRRQRNHRGPRGGPVRIHRNVGFIAFQQMFLR
jgi:hypothetical protein